MSTTKVTKSVRESIVPNSLTAEKIIGLTTLNNAGLHSFTSNIVYCAGCIAVIYNPETNKQEKFFTVSKAISCVAVSNDGQYLAIGERGHLPTITIWNIETSELVATLSGHQHGVGQVAFSPDDHHLISVGFKHDKQLLLWDWTHSKVISCQKVGNKVNAVCFAADGSYFITCGDRHLKWWYIVRNASGTVTEIQGKPASILEAQRDSNFIDICIGNEEHENRVYCLTSSGMLCVLHTSRIMEKYIQIDGPTYAMALSSSAAFVACAHGAVVVYSLEALELISKLPLPPRLPATYTSPAALHPAAVALRLADDRIAAVYADRTMIVYDVSDVLSPVKYRSHVAHKACIWDMHFIDDTPVCEDRDKLPAGTFATCGADNTLCFWNLDSKEQRKSKWRSSISRDLLHCLDIGDGAQAPAMEYRRMGSTGLNSSAEFVEVDLASGVQDAELPDRQQGRQIVRSLAVHPSGKEIICGDRQGVLRVYDNLAMQLVTSIQAHEAEILTLCFSPYSLTQESDLVLLASAGRDRLIHIYDATESASKRYHLLQTLDIHSSSVTIVKFTSDGQRLISCGGDKTMVLNDVRGTTITRVRTIQTSNGAINGLAIDATNKFAITSGQDKRINVWNLSNGRLVRSYRHKTISGELYKSCIDPSGMYVATCSFDKIIRIFDFFSGELIAQAHGHSDLITGIKFSSDGRRIITVGGDGCIMAWKVADELVQDMQDRLVELYANAQKRQLKAKSAVRTGGVSAINNQSSNTESETTSSPSEQNDLNAKSAAKLRLPSDRLPSWAQKRPAVGETGTSVSSSGSQAREENNKWIARLDGQYEVGNRKVDPASERHKLTLEVTSMTEIPAERMGSPGLQKLAATLEDNDAVNTDAQSDDYLDEEFDNTSNTSMTEVVDDLHDEDPLAVTSSNLDALELSAMELEGWLERKLKEEVVLDENISSSLAEMAEPTVAPSLPAQQKKPETSGRAIFGNSLSSDFFKKIKSAPESNKDAEIATAEVRGDDVLPSAPDEVINISTEDSRKSIRDRAMLAKRQETASAVAQMRQRLRAMGVLEKVPQKEEPVSTSPDAKVTKENTTSPPAVVEQVSVAPPLPPVATPAPEQVSAAPPLSSKVDPPTYTAKEEMKNTLPESSEPEDSLIVAEEESDANDLHVKTEEYRKILKELSLVSSRAIEAYSSLQSIHQKQHPEHQESSIDEPSMADATSMSIDASMQYVRPTRIPQSPNKYQRSRSTPPDEVSGLIHDFETSFASMADQWGSVLGRSVIHSSVFPRASNADASVTTDYSLLRAGQSPINAMAATNASQGMGVNDISRLMNDSTASATNVSASDADLLNILERYSDRLVTLVADKIVSRTSNS